MYFVFNKTFVLSFPKTLYHNAFFVKIYKVLIFITQH